MKSYKLLMGLVVAAVFLGVTSNSQPAFADFHLIRIHAVMGGLNGDSTVQYVELRMCSGGQTNLAPLHTLKFYDAAGTIKATFTFPSDVSNPGFFAGESILIATSEFNTASVGPGMGGTGGDADFVFSMANTTGANGGDPLHPVQGVNGKVRFAFQEGEGCDTNIMFDAHDVDSVAYGTAAADLGSAAAALPSPSDNRALRLGTISGPVNNSTDYSLQATSSVAKSVAGGSLTTDLDTPRNNLRQVATLGSSTDTDNDGVLNANDLCPGTPPSTVVDSTGCSDAQVDADLDLVCDPTAPMGHGGGGPPPFCTGSDNCPTTANPTQANVVHPGTPAGDACDDPDLDGVFDASDNCPGNTNSNQANFDGDSQGDACDSEDDGDGYSDEAEAGSPVCMFAVNDDDADDTRINDGCPAVGPAESDCADTVEPLDDDGDGRVNDGCAQVATISEGAFNIGTGTLAACAAGAGPDPSTGWPSDFVSGQVPDSTDKVTISDLSSYVVPARLLDTSPGDTEFAARWDIVPGRGEFGVFADWIAIDDLTALIVGSTGMPPMLGGARALDGPACTGT